MSKKTSKKTKHEPKAAEVVKPQSSVSIILSFIGMLLLLVFLAANIATSQMVHPLYEKVINGEKLATVTFFKIAKNLAAFQPLKPEMEDSYKALAREIDGENITRQEKIKKIEALLVEYPNSRDLLYAASVLYNDIGEKDKAAEYLEKARKIDPSL